jgi:hypothetical protein
MSQHLTADLDRLATITTAPPLVRVERNFGLPTWLYGATIAAYAGFLAVMSAAFMNASLVVPMAICVVYLAMAFGVPMLWTRFKPEDTSHALSGSQFRNRGIQTDTGHLTANEASIQVLILPVLILFWGVAVAIIAAVV